MEFAAAETPVSRAQFMQVALTMARRSLAAGGPPVGACLVQGGEVIARAANAVIAQLDVTAHAEIEVLRQACRQQRRLQLPDCTLYVTVEPCAMCLAACHYAGLPAIVYGAALADMQAITGNEAGLAGVPQALDGGAGIALTGDVLGDECRALLAEWRRQPQRSAGR